jgi:transposase-like protein
MIENSVIPFKNPDQIGDPLTDLLKAGAKQLIQQVVEEELQVLLEQYQGCLTEDGKAAVVRNGYHPERNIQTGIGPVTVKIPKVRNRAGDPVAFHSALVPPYIRKTPSLEAAIPWLYLKGVSTGEMSDALSVLVGKEAAGLSASTVSRLKKQWSDEYHAWRKQDLSKDQWVYIWADGVYSGLRAEDTKLCALVIIGVNERGEKHFLAIEDGVRESTQSWREVLLKLKSRGMKAPKLATGDGAMGFWSALEECYPKTRQQRCWVHKTANVLNCLPKNLQGKAKQDLHDIWQADTRDNAQSAFNLFIEAYEDKYPKATTCLQKDREELMAFYDFPAKHWQSIRTSNPVESCFATIRHRTKRSKGCLSREGMLHMMFKLSQCAEKKWRRLRGFDCLAKVVADVPFKDGIEVKTKDQKAA